jgi:uncharacterized BrkB/YihY/UPF0761 family membrane protein
VKQVDLVVARVDGWQRGHRVAAVAYGVVKKFGDDGANQFVVGLGWYGFLAIYPLLLAITTVLSLVGAASLGHGLVRTLHEFPVIGSQFQPEHGSKELHGSDVALVIGLLGLIYGAQGVTQTVQQAMVRVWNIPQRDVPGFLPRLLRSLGGLTVIGLAYVANAVSATYATGSGTGLVERIPVLIAMVVVNSLFYLLAFRLLTPLALASRTMAPGALVAGLGFTVLITLGSGLIEHQLRNSSATYGQFGVVIGLVGFLFLVAKLTLYGAELNPVLARRLWPRSMRSAEPTEADLRVLRDITLGNLRRSDQRVEVAFDGDPAASDDGRPATVQDDDRRAADQGDDGRGQRPEELAR